MRAKLGPATVLVAMLVSACAAQNAEPTTASNTPGDGYTSAFPMTQPPTIVVAAPGQGAPGAMQTAPGVSRLLAQNDYCQRPCIWGIVPGLTTLDEAHDFFAQLGNPLELGTPDGSTKHYIAYFGKAFGLPEGPEVDIRLEAEGQDVTGIRLRIFPDGSSYQKQLDFWQAYQQDMVLARYGAPSSVDFSRSVGPSMGSEERVHWITTLYFDSWGLIAQYASAFDYADRVSDDGTVTICPGTDPIDEASVWLGMTAAAIPHRGLRLEDASPLSLQEYREEVLNGQNCLALAAGALFP